MKTSQKTILIIFILFIIGLAYLYLKPNEDISPVVESSPVPDTVSSLQVYRNEKYGFELTFPKTWGKVTTTENGYNIFFRSSNAEGDGLIFYISAMTEQEWKDCEESAKTGIPNCAGMPIDNAMVNDSGMVINWASSNQDPYPLQEERLQELDEVFASFKYTR